MSKELKSLAQHNAEATAAQLAWHECLNRSEPNGIACPTCGNELQDTNPVETLTSFPAQKNVHCRACGFKEYRVV